MAGVVALVWSALPSVCEGLGFILGNSPHTLTLTQPDFNMHLSVCPQTRVNGETRKSSSKFIISDQAA